MYTLNGKNYPDIELSYNEVCNLDAKGIDISNLGDIQKSPMYLFRILRAIIAISFNGNESIAGDEIEAHLKNGGTLDDLVKVFTTAVEKSGFFQALGKKA